MDQAGTKRPTLADVAKAAGVSTAVVSYVMNNGPRNVSPESRKRVEDAIKKLNYRRNTIASALVGGTTNLVGLLVPDASNLFFGEMAREFEREALSRGYLTMIGNTNNDSEIETRYISALSDLHAYGAFVVSINERAQNDHSIPQVYVHSAPRDSTAPNVLFDDFNGGRMATRHLIDLGYHNIHCMVGASEFGPLGVRRDGWKHEMTKAGLPTAGRAHFVSANRTEAAQDIKQVIASSEPPRAIFATTDEQAISAMRAARELDLSIPDDLAIVGFDGVSEARLGSVKISTIQLPLRDFALRAFDILENPEREQKKTLLMSGALWIGETCGANLKDRDP